MKQSKSVYPITLQEYLKAPGRSHNHVLFLTSLQKY